MRLQGSLIIIVYSKKKSLQCRLFFSFEKGFNCF